MSVCRHFRPDLEPSVRFWNYERFQFVSVQTHRFDFGYFFPIFELISFFSDASVHCIIDPSVYDHLCPISETFVHFQILGYSPRPKTISYCYVTVFFVTLRSDFKHFRTVPDATIGSQTRQCRTLLSDFRRLSVLRFRRSHGVMAFTDNG